MNINKLFRVAPETQGISTETLLRLVAEFKKLDSLHSLMILRNGKVCLECWWKPFAPEIPHILFSLSKSFTSVAIGIAQGEGKLRVTDPVLKFFPEYDSAVVDPKMRAVTLHDLLAMASGHDKCAVDLMKSDPEGDWVRGFLSSRLEKTPGTSFAYNSAATYMLAAVIRKITGENVREYLIPRLFAPLGIEPGIWECCPKGTNVGGWGLYLKTEDIAKFGQLLLNRGYDGEKQLIPEDYLKAATSAQIDNSSNDNPDWRLGYGYQFWVSQHGYRGDGAHGQYAIVIPELNMAVAVTAAVDDMQNILNIFWKILIPEVKADPIPVDAGKTELLKQLTDSLSIPPVADNLKRKNLLVQYEFCKNEAGIRALEVRAEEVTCSLIFQTENGKEVLTAGFGFNCDNQIQLIDLKPHRTVASATWISDTLLEIHVCFYETTFRDIYRIDFAAPAAPLTRSSRYTTFRPPFPQLETVAVQA